MSAISNNNLQSGNGVENSMLFILFIAGILGVFYLLNQPDKAGPIQQQNDTINNYSSVLYDNSTNPNNAYLVIDGAMEQDVPIRFTISSFNEQVRYVLDFGNGIRREVIKPELSYTYRESGAFRLKLIALYRGSEKLLYSELLYISRNSEVAGEF